MLDLRPVTPRPGADSGQRATDPEKLALLQAKLDQLPAAPEQPRKVPAWDVATEEAERVARVPDSYP